MIRPALNTGMPWARAQTAAPVPHKRLLTIRIHRREPRSTIQPAGSENSA